MRWPLQPLQPLQQTQLQPPFVQSVDSLCHPWFTTNNVSYRFPILKLPPPPCAALLVCFNYFYSTKVCLWHVSKWFDNSELLAILCYVFVDRHCRRLVAHMTLNAWWGALAQSPTANIPWFAVRGWAEGGWKAARFDSCWQEIVPLFNDFR